MKILVIDDDPLIRRLVGKMLEGVAGVYGYVVVSVLVAGEDRIRRWAVLDHDVVLCDYNLGLDHLNGLDVLRLAPAGCRRVLMSGDTPSDVPSNVVVLGKPFTREGLLASLGLAPDGPMVE